MFANLYVKPIFSQKSEILQQEKFLETKFVQTFA
jgi:hypothetical protein